jgi:hypothetical protein
MSVGTCRPLSDVISHQPLSAPKSILISTKNSMLVAELFLQTRTCVWGQQPEMLFRITKMKTR